MPAPVGPCFPGAGAAVAVPVEPAARGGGAAAVMWHRGGVDVGNGPLRWPAVALCNAAARAGAIIAAHRAVTHPLGNSGRTRVRF